MAILGVLLEEHDADERPKSATTYTLPGEETEIELQRVSVYGTVRNPIVLRITVFSMRHAFRDL
jgi:hypothetical protein